MRENDLSNTLRENEVIEARLWGSFSGQQTMHYGIFWGFFENRFSFWGATEAKFMQFILLDAPETICMACYYRGASLYPIGFVYLTGVGKRGSTCNICPRCSKISKKSMQQPGRKVSSIWRC